MKGWRALPDGTPVILATVVATSGSTYRKPGAKMLITPDKWVAGSISGGCLESDLTQSAWEKTESGPTLVTYDATADEDILWGYGLGCNGTVQVFLERIDEPGGPLAFFSDCYERGVAGVVSTVLSHGPEFGRHAYVMDESRTVGLETFEGVTRFFDPVTPRLELFVFGAGHDSLPLVRLGKALGWRVTVVDKRAQALSKERFSEADSLIVCAPEDVAKKVILGARSAVVLMTHHYLHDRQLLQYALGSPASYVGLLGPKRRAERLLSDLRDDGFVATEAQVERLHAPIGLDIGAEGPDEIALAIVAEIQAFLKRKQPASLRESDVPIHAASDALLPTEALSTTQCGLLA